MRRGGPARTVRYTRRGSDLGRPSCCRDGPRCHAWPVVRFCPWREEGREGADPTESDLAGRGLPWQAEATLCGTLNSPAGLTFLSLRGAAPASFPEPFPTIPYSTHSARSTRFPSPVSPFTGSRVSGIHFPTPNSFSYTTTHVFFFFSPHTAAHRAHFI